MPSGDGPAGVAPTMAGVLGHWSAAPPDHHALRWKGGEPGRSALEARASQVAHAWRPEGVARGDRGP